MASHRDQRIADDVGLEQSLRCKAHGCPCLWSVNFGAKLCSAHALCKSAGEWPIVTQRLLEEESERALYGPPPRPPIRTVTVQEAIASMRAIRTGRLFERAGPKAWARRLEAAEADGRSLSRYQRDAWRKALGHVVLDAAREGAPVPRAGITDALQATGDLPTEETTT